MRKIYAPTVLFILALSNFVNAQAPDWLWAKSAGGSKNDRAQAISIDSAGNVYMVGFYTSPSIKIGNDSLSNAGTGFNLLVSKYDASGNFIWAKNPGVDAVSGYSISADASGNSYIAGYIKGQNIPFGNASLSSGGDGNGNVIAAKFDAEGNVLWAKTDVGSGNDFGFGVSNDLNGNCFVTGNFGSATCSFGNYTLVNSGLYTNVFVTKYDSAGNVKWAKSAGGESYGTGSVNYASGSGISTDANGNCYVTGYFESATIVFGQDTLTNAAGKDMGKFFIARYGPQGNVLWAKCPSGKDYSGGGAISTDAHGNSYVAGIFYDTLIVAKDTLITTTGQYSIFTAKYDSSGNLLWIKNSSAWNSGPQPTKVANKATDDGNSYLTGFFENNIFIFGNDTLVNPDSASLALFVVKYDASGNALWAKCAGGGAPGGYFDCGEGVTADSYGNCYITGAFTSPMLVLGRDTLENMAVNSIYNGNIFIAKLGESVATGVAATNNTSNPIIIFPNPSTGQFYFKGVSEGCTIQIYNVLGQTIYSAPATGDNYTVNLSGTAKGIYFYNVRNRTGEIQQGKLVLQ